MIQTNNIYYAAYMFTVGMPFTGAAVEIDTIYGRTVMFSFKGESAEKEQMYIDTYEDNLAEVRLCVYLESLGLVRDITNRLMKTNEHHREERPIGKPTKLPRIRK